MLTSLHIRPTIHRWIVVKPLVTSFITDHRPNQANRKASPKSCMFSTSVRNEKLVLGIETSCDDTGAAVINEDGCVLGEALNSQNALHVL